MDERRFRLDFVIALGALLISTIAAVATVYQTHVIAAEFSATVWPYVSFEENNSPWSVELDVRNDGLGPAIIRSVGLTFDGKPQRSIEGMLAEFAAREPQALTAARAALRAGAKLKITTSTPSSGLVIPANTQHVVIRLEGPVLARNFQPVIKHVGIALCYCSLTGTCWTQRFQNRDSEPKVTPACPRS